MSREARSPRWPLVLTFVSAATTSVLLGAAIADAEGSRGLLLLALLSFAIFVTVGGVWTFSLRPDPNDAAAERADAAAKMAAELRNPLMSIRGLASSGVRQYEDMSDEERKEFLTLMDEEAGRLSRVAEQMTIAMRIEAEQITYDMHAEDLGAVIEEVAWRAPYGQHPMVVESEPDLTVEIDRLRFGELVANLVDNAAKFSPPDAPIEVRAYRDEDGDAIVEIADGGPGIPPAMRDEVFRRSSTWRPPGYEETPGPGLGLYIAQAHAIAHGGRIQIDDRGGSEASEDGPSGTLVRLALPAPS